MTFLRFRRWLGLWMALVPCLACASPVVGVFQVSGVVVSRRDGSRIADCRISASYSGPAQDGGPRGVGGAGRVRSLRSGQQPDRPNDQPVEGTADGSGRFVLALPSAGEWRLTATAKGFRGQNFDEHDGFYAGIVLTEAEPSYSMTFRLTPDAGLVGSVLDEAGEPVDLAQVTAVLVPVAMPESANSAARPRPAGFAQTDDLGRFEMGGLSPGMYRIRVQAQPWYAAGRGFVAQPPNGSVASAPLEPSLDLIYATTWFPGTDDEAAAETLLLAPGEQRQADFHLSPIAAVHLRVPRAAPSDGTPASVGQERRAGGVNMQRFEMPTIRRLSGDQMGFGQMQQLSGLQGSEWDFGGLSPGRYELRTPGPGGQADATVEEIDVRPGATGVMTIAQAKPLIAVTVMVEGERTASVEFVDRESGNRVNTQVLRRAPGGAFGRADGAPEAVKVMLEAHRYDVFLNGVAAAYLTGVSAVGAAVEGRTVSIVGPTSLILHTAIGRGQVSGVAKTGGPHGQPAEGAMVLLVPATLGQPGDLRTVMREEANSDGSFSLPRVIPGRYILVAIESGWQVDWRDAATLLKYLAKGVALDLPAGGVIRKEIEAVGR
jgi:hypothetical protein